MGKKYFGFRNLQGKLEGNLKFSWQREPTEPSDPEANAFKFLKLFMSVVFCVVLFRNKKKCMKTPTFSTILSKKVT